MEQRDSTAQEAEKTQNLFPPGDVEVDPLHQAALTLFTDLSLDGVLQRIAQAAMDLADARYAALGVPDGRGGLETFISLGLSPEERAAMEHPPIGKGLIGEMLRQGRTIRIPEIRDHPASQGFPEGHPEMRSFLGVPIIAYGRPLGQIYLTEKRYAAGFNEEDQRLVEMLAAFAAAAIENARLYRQVLESELELTQRNEELELVNSLAGAVSSAMEVEELLNVLLDRTLAMFEAQAGEVFLHDPAENVYRRVVHRGEFPENFWELERFRSGEGLIGEVAQSQQPRWINELSGEVRYLRAALLDAGMGAMVSVPLVARGAAVGVLTLVFRGDRTVSEREIGLLGAVGAGISVGVENARLARQSRRLAVLEERERIGMDLHDGIIQSIYAVGLTLDYVRLLAQKQPGEAEKRLEQAIDGLNAVIRDIRNYILDLQPSRIQIKTLDEALRRLIREFKANTLVETILVAEGEVVDRILPAPSMAFFHIAQEALANVGKHAQASRAWVQVRHVNQEVMLQVIDNGRGFKVGSTPGRLGHGLSNMEERARQAGGSFALLSSPGEGTTITVRLPQEVAWGESDIPAEGDRLSSPEATDRGG